ncbi:MAG: DUF4446 family protein [Chloroflexi bacterium]|nr:DUF4446 family protein [Chloroflexota bacterium]
MEILVVILLLALIALGGWVVFLELRHQKLAAAFRTVMTGRAGADLESILMDYLARMDRVEQVAQAVEQHLVHIESKMPFLIQHVGIVRFNPFSDKGGDQSFVVAVLDDHTDGFVFSGLHSRTDVRVYAKPVVSGQSTYTLTAEEKEAIARAMKPRT